MRFSDEKASAAGRVLPRQTNGVVGSSFVCGSVCLAEATATSQGPEEDHLSGNA